MIIWGFNVEGRRRWQCRQHIKKMAMQQEPIDWRYRFHIFLAYFSGLNFRKYPHKIWPYMVLTYLHFRILKLPLNIQSDWFWSAWIIKMRMSMVPGHDMPWSKIRIQPGEFLQAGRASDAVSGYVSFRIILSFGGGFVLENFPFHHFSIGWISWFPLKIAIN